MLINKLGLFAEILILLASIVLPLIFKPKFDFVCWSQDTFHVFLVVIGLHHRLASFPNSPMQSSFKRIKNVSELGVLLRAIFDISKKDRCVDR